MSTTLLKSMWMWVASVWWSSVMSTTTGSRAKHITGVSQVNWWATYLRVRVVELDVEDGLVVVEHGS